MQRHRKLEGLPSHSVTAPVNKKEKQAQRPLGLSSSKMGSSAVTNFYLDVGPGVSAFTPSSVAYETGLNDPKVIYELNCSYHGTQKS